MMRPMGVKITTSRSVKGAKWASRFPAKADDLWIVGHYEGRRKRWYIGPPTPENQAYEQWFVQAGQLTKTLDTHLPTNYVAIPGRLMRDTHTLGLNAGKSLNRVCRNKLFCAYAGGQTLTDNEIMVRSPAASAGSADTPSKTR